MGYVAIVLSFLLFSGCCFCPKYRRVYCDSVNCIEHLQLGCEIIEIRERKLPPKYRAKVKCPERKKKKRCNK